MLRLYDGGNIIIPHDNRRGSSDNTAKLDGKH